MIIDENTIRLIYDLEYLLGKECYNPNSYDGFTGEEGCAFRYPLSFKSAPTITHEQKTKESLNSAWNQIIVKPNYYVVSSMKYKFGSNHLFVGKGIENILNELEKRYNLDFSELEKNLNNKE